MSFYSATPARCPPKSGERRGSQDNELVRDNLQLRVERAREDYSVDVPEHPSNGDEARYANKIGTDTRGLPHNQFGASPSPALMALQS